MSVNLLKASLTLSSAQVLSLVETPIQLVSAPGAGTYIAVVNFFFTYDAVTTPYTAASGEDCIILGTPNQITGGAGYQVAVLQEGFITQPTSQYIGLGGLQPSETGIALPTSSADNAPLMVSATTDPTSGDGTVSVVVYYTIEPIL